MAEFICSENKNKFRVTFAVMDISHPEKQDDVSLPIDLENGESSSNQLSATDAPEFILSNPIIQFNVTSILNYCKTKILKPYLRLLSLMGLRPINIEHDDTISCLVLFSYLYTFQVIIFMLIGYILQYMACFRRDRGFGYRLILEDPFSSNDVDTYEKICHGSVLFSYIIPNSLHLVAYLYAVFVFRNSDDDQLMSLMEKVFLSLSNLADGFISQRRLIKTLWVFVTISIIWMLLSFATVNFMMAEGNVDFKWVENGSHEVRIIMKVLLVICTLWHDMIQATIVSNYCLQAQLLISYAIFLKDKVLQYPIQPMEWMREINEFKKLVNFFNDRLAPAVCIFIAINLSYSISGVLWLLNYDHLDKESVSVYSVCVLNIVLWILITCVPVVQAARLSNTCEILQGTGHEVRGRPFSHQNTPSYKLDAMLLFASSLKINARLFGIPITGKYMIVTLTAACVIILVMGQLHYLNDIMPL